MTFEEFIEEWLNDAPYITAHSSGSTGTPKEIELSKEFVKRSGIRTNKFFNITSESRLHSCVSPNFIGGKMMAVRADLAKCKLTYETPSNCPLQDVHKNEVIDLLAVVPSQMLHIVDNPDVMPDIRAVIIGGSAIDDRLRDKIIASGLNTYETYGMTETSSHIALRKIDPDVEWFETLEGIRVSLDVRGCLVIEFDSGEKIVTNDLAVVGSEDQFVIAGRWDDVIITGGKKVNPFETERKISQLFNTPFIITSRRHIKWGEEIILKIEGQPACEDNELISKLKKILDPWEVPKGIEYVDRLPRTSNGKLKRR